MANGENCYQFTGDETGLVIPAHGDALREGGAAWLTAAFRAFGSLGQHNEEVLSGLLGMSAAEVAVLRAKGIV